MTNKEKIKLQKVQIQILDEIKRICDDNNLKVFLIGGTCLGSVRHNGFIPWDDDVDIGMMRDDYERFIKICKKELDSKYYLQSMDTDDDYPHSFIKIRANNTLLLEKLNVGKKMHQGIFVDIFPFDYGSNHMMLNKLKQIYSIFIREAYFQCLGYPVKAKTTFQAITLPIIKAYAKIHSTSFIKRKCKRFISKQNRKKSKYICNFVGYALFKDIYDADIFNEYTTHKFENNKYCIFKNYDKYLTTLYGDYMTPPPKEKREIGHGVIKIDFNTNKKKAKTKH